MKQDHSLAMSKTRHNQQYIKSLREQSFCQPFSCLIEKQNVDFSDNNLQRNLYTGHCLQ